MSKKALLSHEEYDRERVSAMRGDLYNELKDARDAALRRGDARRAEDLQSMMHDATQIDPSMWLDVIRVAMRSRGDANWLHSLIHENNPGFESLKEMFSQYVITCDAADAGPNSGRAIDERHNRWWGNFQKRNAESKRKFVQEAQAAGFLLRVPDDT
jgi:hypothetical protein